MTVFKKCPVKVVIEDDFVHTPSVVSCFERFVDNRLKIIGILLGQ